MGTAQVASEMVAGRHAARRALLGGAAWLAGPALLGWGWAEALWAAVLTVPWLTFTFLIALGGLIRLCSRGAYPLAEVCVDAGLVFLAVGGGWVFLSRSGAEPLGFREPIVLLTGVHFHYAGFTLPLLTGLAARQLQSKLARTAAAGVMVGVPLVALGITLSPLGIQLVEWLASWFMAAVGLVVAGLQMQLAARAEHPAVRLLFGLSGLSLVTGMILAAIYALGTYGGYDWLDIRQMLPWHGAVNAVGFGLLGLLAWQLDSPGRE